MAAPTSLGPPFPESFHPSFHEEPIMTNAYIAGWGHTPFGKLDNVELEQLIRDAVQPALDSAGLEPKDIDGIFVGHFNAGFVGQDFTASLPAVAMPRVRQTPPRGPVNARPP